MSDVFLNSRLRPFRVGGENAGAFNKKITSPTEDKASRAVRDKLVAGMLDGNKVHLGFGPGIFYSSSDSGTYDIRSTDWGSHPAQHKWYFKIPSNATPTPDSVNADRPLLVYDMLNPKHPVELRCWHTVINHSTKVVYCDGYSVTDCGSGVGSEPCDNGLPKAGAGTGCGLTWPGLIRASDVGAGRIEHALRFAGPDWTSGRYRLPAIKSDQDGPGPLDMGMRIYLDISDADIDKRTLPNLSSVSREVRFLKMFCTALKEYGAISSDGQGSDDISFHIENDTRKGGTASWKSLIGSTPIKDGSAVPYYGWLIRSKLIYPDSGWRDTDGVPWEKIKVLSTSIF